MSWWPFNRKTPPTVAAIERALEEDNPALARSLLKKHLASTQGELTPALAQLSYEAWKYQPTDKRFHQAAATRLKVLAESDGAIEEMLEVYLDYAAVTQGRLGLEDSQLLSLAEHFAVPAHINEAADLVRRVLHKDDRNPQLAHAMLSVANAYTDIDPPHSRRLLYDIIGLFPESPEARIAKKTLGK